MTGSFIAVPIAALFCYIFLMVAFMAAKKTKLINSFLMMLGALTLWTGGSFCMRMQLVPSIKFWYDISILGLTLLPLALINFVDEFVGSKETLLKKVWLLLFIIINIVNIATGILLAHPVLMHTNNEVRFVYYPTWTAGILFVYFAAVAVHMLYVLVKNSKNDELTRKQFAPIIVGLMILFIGHLFVIFSIFQGFPTDILSGVINAFCIFYALCKRRLFKLTLLVSRGLCYFITLGLTILIFSNAVNFLEQFILTYFQKFAEYDVLIIAVLFTLATLLIYYGIKMFIDNVFIKEEIIRAENFKKFSYFYDDVNFLASVDSIGSIAVKNSKLYKKVFLETRTDELTGLLNRKYFYETIQQEYDKNKDHSLALVILNIDDFKLYNQLYGNKEGDVALQKVAQIIRATVGENGYVARYGAKEFAIILPMYDILSSKTLAENIRKQILNMNKRARDYTLKALTVSGGICAIPHSANTVKQLIDNADMAVYHAKRKGKNLILAYSVEKKTISKESNKKDEQKKVDIYSEYASTIYALTAAIDAKDHYTFNHSKRVAYYATKLAYAYGMDEDYVKIIKEAALLHDIGKIGIPEHILNKPGKLDEEEFEVVRSHVENSIGIIRHLPSLDYVIPAIIGHHERYDGRGYPRRISKEDIPISARMLCIADSFDAMISQRCYKQPRPVYEALEVLEQEAGRQFDPVLVPIFVHLVKNGLINADDEGTKVYEEEASM